MELKVLSGLRDNNFAGNDSSHNKTIRTPTFFACKKGQYTNPANTAPTSPQTVPVKEEKNVEQKIYYM